MDLSYSFNDMELHLIGTRVLPSSTVAHTAASPNALNILDILLSCLEAGKAYLDTILAIPSSQYRLFSFIEWMRLPYVILKISKLSFPSSHFTNAHWDVLAAQERVRLELCLESLCYRLQTLTTCKDPNHSAPDFYSSIKLILEHTRNWYLRRTRLPFGEDSANADQEDSPLEVIRDPNEATGSLASTHHDSPEQRESGTRHAIADIDVPENSETIFPGMNVADVDGLLDNFDDAFWTSNLFETSNLSDV